MAGEPLGKGEIKHPKEGNALLITRSINGQEVKTPLWIVQFATDLNLQVDSTQTRRGLVHRPIRFAERYLTFTTIWNVLDRPKYLQLGEKLKAHWAYNLNEQRPTPMIFRYYGANKTWKGFIENWETAFAITDVVLSYTFNMRIITTPDKNQPAESRSVPKTNVPYAPTAGDIKDYGPEWQTGKYFGGSEDKSETTKKHGKDTKKGGQTTGGGKGHSTVPTKNADSDVGYSSMTQDEILGHYLQWDSGPDLFNPPKDSSKGKKK